VHPSIDVQTGYQAQPVVPVQLSSFIVESQVADVTHPAPLVTQLVNQL
jgi:hypothetical protein